MTIGPRVGGAHVDVNLSLDDRSISAVGKRIQRQLAQISKRNGRLYRTLGQDAVVAWRAALGATLAATPLMGSALSGLTGAATMLAGSVREVGVASGALLPIVSSLGFAATTAAFGFRNIGAAIMEINPKALQEQLDSMTPSARAFALTMRGLVKDLQRDVQPRIFAGLIDEINLLRRGLIPAIHRGFLSMADAINSIIKSLMRYGNSAKGLQVIDTALQGQADLFASLGRSVVPFLDGFLRLLNALLPAATRLSDRIYDIGLRFQRWASAAGFAERIDNRMKGAEKTAGLLFKVLGNLSKAIGNIFTAINPSTNTFLEMLVGVTERFKEWSASAGGKNTLSEWASNSVEIMRQFGHTLEAVFNVLAELSEPGMIISFLKTVQDAFELLAKLPLDKIVLEFISLADALRPISGPMLAFVASGAAIQILIGNLLGQIAGVSTIVLTFMKFRLLSKIMRGMAGGTAATGTAAAQAAPKLGFFARIWATILNALRRARSIFSAVTGLFGRTTAATETAAASAGRFSGALRPVLTVLSRVAKFAGLAGLAVWIGTLIAGSEKLQKKLGTAFKAFGGIFTSLKEAFAEIGAAFTPAASGIKKAGVALTPVFNILDKIGVLVLSGIFDTITYGFKSVANVIKGAGSIIAGFVTVLTGLLTWDFGKMWEGIKQIASGIGPLLKGLFGVFVSFFAPARFIKLAVRPIRALGSAIGRGISKLASQLGKYLLVLWGGFQGLIAPLGSVGDAFQKVVDVIVNAAKWLWDVLFGHSIFPDIMAAFGVFVGVVQKLFNVWVGAFRIAVNAFKIVGSFLLSVFRNIGVVIGAVLGVVRAVITKVFKVIRSVISRAWRVVEKTTGRVWEFISTTVQTTLDILRAIIQKVFSAIRTIITGVWNAVKTGTSKVWRAIRTVVSTAITGVKTVVSRIFGNIRTAISGVWDSVKTKTSGIWESIKTVVDKAVGGVKTLVTEGFDGIWNTIKGLPGKIIDLGSRFLSAGKEIGGKIVTGIGNGLKNIVSGIGNFGKLVKDKINNALGLPKKIHGPGPIPDFTIPGFARGVRNFSGGLAMVGEEGRELVSLPRGSNVYSNRQTESALAAAHNTTSNVVINQNYYGPTTSGGRLREIDWTLRYATKAKQNQTGLATV